MLYLIHLNACAYFAISSYEVILSSICSPSMTSFKGSWQQQICLQWQRLGLHQVTFDLRITRMINLLQLAHVKDNQCNFILLSHYKHDHRHAGYLIFKAN